MIKDPLDLFSSWGVFVYVCIVVLWYITVMKLNWCPEKLCSGVSIHIQYIQVTKTLMIKTKVQVLCPKCLYPLLFPVLCSVVRMLMLLMVVCMSVHPSIGPTLWSSDHMIWCYWPDICGTQISCRALVDSHAPQRMIPEDFCDIFTFHIESHLNQCFPLINTSPKHVSKMNCVISVKYSMKT